MDKRRMTAAGAAALLLALSAAGCAGENTEIVSGDGEVSMTGNGRRMWTGSWRRRRNTGRT